MSSKQVEKLPPGEYYLGDPYLVLHRDLVDKIKEEVKDAQVIVAEGRSIFVAKVPIRMYTDNLLQEYAAAGGLIALIPLGFCALPQKIFSLGLSHKFEAHTAPIEVFKHDNEIHINCRVLK